MPVRVLLTTLAGDTPWMAKILCVAGATATNGCHECYVPTLQVRDPDSGKRKQKYTAYRRGFELTQPMLDVINKSKTEVSKYIQAFLFVPYPVLRESQGNNSQAHVNYLL